MATEAGLLPIPVPYGDASTTLTGLIFHNGAPGPRRGLLVVHGGAGLDDHARGQAQRYAELGYVVLAADMFGPEVAGDRPGIVALVTALRDDPARLARRTRAAVTALAAQPDVVGPVAAIGFCFGGMAVLALARAGEPLAALRLSVISIPVPAEFADALVEMAASTSRNPGGGVLA